MLKNLQRAIGKARKPREAEIILLAILCFVTLILFAIPHLSEQKSDLAGQASEKLVNDFFNGGEQSSSGKLSETINGTSISLENLNTSLYDAENQTNNVTGNIPQNNTTDNATINNETTINETIINDTISEDIINNSTNITGNITENQTTNNITIDENNNTNESINTTTNKIWIPVRNKKPQMPDEELTILLFSSSDISFEKKQGYDIIYLEDLQLAEEEGNPMLPFKQMTFSIPYDKKVLGIEIAGYQKEELSGEYDIVSLQYTKEDEKGIMQENFIPLDLTQYNPASMYPEKIVDVEEEGFIRENKIVKIRINPLQYNPTTKKAVLHTMIAFKLNLKDAEEKTPDKFLEIRKTEDSAFNKIVSNMVENPEDIQKNKKKTMKETTPANVITGNVIIGGDTSPLTLPPFQNTRIDYIIITNNYDLDGTYVGDLQSDFQRLADWKIKKGISTLVVNLTWIKDNFPEGYDTQESIRNFLREAYYYWGTQYVLIGGDTEIIPSRFVYYPRLSVDVPTDLYYADIDSDWNDNKDSIILDSEVTGAYPDLLVGRAPVNNPEQTEVFISKTLIYEKSAPADYINNMLFLAGPFNERQGCNDGNTFPNHKEDLNETWVPDYIRPYRLYTPYEYSTTKTPYYVTAFSDLDSDGIEESIIGTYLTEEDYTNIHVVGEDGLNFGNWPVMVSGHIKNVYPEDIDMDGDKEIFVILGDSNNSMERFIYAWNSTGDYLPGWFNKSVSYITKLNFTDMDGNGKKEIIYSDEDCYINILDIDGNEHFGWPRFVNVTSSFAIYICPTFEFEFEDDLVEIGKKEIYVKPRHFPWTYFSYVYGFKEDGEYIDNNWPLNLSTMGLSHLGNILFEDIDSDGEIELLIETINQTNMQSDLYIFEKNLTIKQGWPKENISKNAYIDAIDFVGDQKPEIILSKNIDESWEYADREENTLFAWNDTGNLISGFPLQNMFTEKIYAEDLDNNGQIELFFVGSNLGEIYLEGWGTFYVQLSNLNILENDGSFVEGWPIENFTTLSNPIFEDVNNDETREIIISGYPMNYANNKGINVLRQDATSIKLITEPYLSRFFLDDLDGDEEYEFIIFEGQSNNKSVHVTDYLGNELSGWPNKDVWQLTNTILYAGNFDASPEKEIIYSSNDSAFFNCRKIDGTNCTGWPYMFYEDLSIHHYTADMLLNKSNAIDELNKGYHIVNHEDHSSIHGLGTGWNCFGETINDKDMDELTNAPHYSIIWSDGCDPNAFDYFSVSEHSILSPNGGAVVFIGNTRSGYARQYVQDDAFFNALYNHSSYIIGKAFIESQIAGTYTYDKYALNMLGDPSLEVWTDNPNNLSLIYDESIRLGLRTFNVNVFDQSTLEPIENASVCITKDDEMFEKALTDTEGLATLTLNPETLGSANITVTAHNYYPVENNITITLTSEPHLIINNISIDDNLGNGNGIIDSGETIDIIINVSNNGDAAVNDLNAQITTDHPCVSIINGNNNYGYVDAEETATGSFVVEFSPECPDYSRIGFDLGLVSGSYSETDHFSLEVSAPELNHLLSRVEEIVGDGDGLPEAGETISLAMVIRNDGNGIAEDISLELTSTEPTINIIDGNRELGDIPPNSETFVKDLTFSVDPTFSENVVSVALELHDSYGRTTTKILNITKPEESGNITFDSSTLQSVRIKWDAPEDTSNIQGYNIYRSDSPEGTLERINKRVISGASIFEDIPPEMGIDYYYSVTSLDNSSTESSLSSSAKIQAGLAMQDGWPQFLGRGTESAPKTIDINNDSYMEVFVAGDKLYGFNYDGSPLDNFPISISDDDDYRATVAVGDLENDGNLEIVAHSSGNNRIYVFDINTGIKLWDKATAGLILSSPLISDLDGDGLSEVLAGSSDAKLYAWHYDGTELMDGDNNASTDGVFSEINADYSYSSASVGDVDLDGDLEIFWGSGNGKRLYAWHHNGTELIDGDNNPSTKGVFSIFEDLVNSNPVIVDLFDDEEPEIVVNTKSELFVFKNNGSVLMQESIGRVPSGPTSSPAIGDLDGDGSLDLVIGNKENIYAYNLNGESLDGWPVDIGGIVQSSVVLADIDQDSYLEVFVGSSDKKMYGFYRNGTPVISFPFDTAEAISASSAVADLDNDSDIELLFVSQDSKVYVFDFPGVYEKGLVMWSEDMFDSQNTGNFSYQCNDSFECGDWSDTVNECGTRDCYCWCVGEIGCAENGIETKDCPTILGDGDSDGDGGRGGGYYTSPCEEDWTCESWSVCSKSLQTRTCTDLNNCSTNESKPLTTQSCIVTEQNLNQTYNDSINISGNESNPEEQEPTRFGFAIFKNNILISITIIVLLVAEGFFATEKVLKKKKDKKYDKRFSQLERYVFACKKQGKSDDFIVQNLKVVGWPEKFVRNKLKEGNTKKNEKI